MAKNKKIIVGDLWDQKGFKVISTNLGGIHGRGLAQQAKQKGYITPQNIDFDTSPKNSDVITLAVKGNAPETAKLKGKAFSESTTGGNVKLLDQEVNKLINFARTNPSKRVNLPMVGLGFGEGDPKVIKPILERASKEPNIFLISKDEATAKKYSSTFKPGIRSDKTSFKNVNNAVKNLQTRKSASTPSRKGIFIQTPSEGIDDPDLFKKNITKIYREAKQRHGDVTVLFRDISKKDSGDLLLRQWAGEGLTEIEKAPYKTKAGRVWRAKLDETGKPNITKSRIPLHKIGANFRDKDKVVLQKRIQDQLKHWESQGTVQSISVNTSGEIVYPGKDTKPHFERFEELTKGLGYDKGVEAYLDELEDFGSLQFDPTSNTAEGNKKMLAGIQVIEEKTKSFKKNIAKNKTTELYSDKVLQRIHNIKKDSPHPLHSLDRLSTDIDTGKEFVDTEGKGIDTDIGKYYKKKPPTVSVDPNDARNIPDRNKLQKGNVKGSRLQSFSDFLDSSQRVETITATDNILVNEEGIARRETKTELVRKDLKKSTIKRKGITKPYDNPDALVQNYQLAEVTSTDVNAYEGSDHEDIKQLTEVSEAELDEKELKLKKQDEAVKSMKKFRRYKNPTRALKAETEFRKEYYAIDNEYAKESDTLFDVTAHTDKEAKEKQVKKARVKTTEVEDWQSPKQYSEQTKTDRRKINKKSNPLGLIAPTSSTLRRLTKDEKDKKIIEKIIEGRRERVEGSYQMEGFYITRPEDTTDPDLKRSTGWVSSQFGIQKARHPVESNIKRLPGGGWTFENKFKEFSNKASRSIPAPEPVVAKVTTEVTSPLKKATTTRASIEQNLATRASNKQKKLTLSAQEARTVTKKVQEQLSPKKTKTKVTAKKSTFGAVKYLSRFMVGIPPLAAYYSLSAKKAEAKPKDKDKVITPSNLAKETTSILFGSHRVFSGYGEKPGYINKLGVGGEYDRKGLLKHFNRPRNKPIKGAGGPDTPFAKFMNYRKKNQAITKQIKY